MPATPPARADTAPYQPLSRAWSRRPRVAIPPIDGVGLAAARWTFDGRTQLPIAPMPLHRVVINLSALRRHTMWIDGRLARDAATPVGALRIAAPHEPGAADVWGEPECAFAQIYIAPADLGAAAEAMGHAPARLRDPRFDACDLALLQAVNRLLDADAAPARTLFRERAAQGLLAHLLRLYGDAAPSPAAGRGQHAVVQRVIEFIDADPARDHSLAELAPLAGVDVFSLARLFKRHTGIGPYRFVIRARIRRACALIARGELPLKQIAQDLGFADQSHFIRHFRAVTGTTPLRFARDRMSALPVLPQH